MKKLSTLLLMGTLVLGACGQNSSDKGEQLEVYTTVFPFKSMTEQIGGDHVEVKSIYPNGTDIHTFEPTQQDTLNIAKGDLFIYSSDELDPVAAKINKAAKNKNTLAVASNLEEKQLLEHHHDHGDEHEHEHEHGHEESAHDPHVWLDPVMNKTFAKEIKDKLVKLDPENKKDYSKNYEKLVKEIDDIDTQLKQITKNPKRDTVYISHESIGYLANRYHFTEKGVSGMNNEEPSQQEIVTMINDINDLKVPYILYEQNIPSKITDVIKDKTKTEALKFHNMSVLTDDDVKNKDVTYQTIMKQNVESLDKALNQ
ncbi:metal ABC transporter solute-binding protein, Zn/Mn family [Macrococcus brunensis]|uniref:metal ABC transporter solute-binding protein, Zn/Mn family n=1 Tax=Macrococcus brunensis TaxID=198483 RepID=UPI001EF147F7|nr:zinc ABC transporter substrate-binding protein [Macrococcus brunensis]ULG73249.1 zinc ABC transporter substrate-binding protein [Macrococcus brunensis]